MRMMRGLGAVAWLAVVVGWALPAPAQRVPAEAGSPADQPTSFGIRFTPGMARSLAGGYVRMLTERYELDPSKVDQTEDAVARRFMALAHRLDDEGFGEALEGMVEGILAGQMDAGRQDGMNLKSAQAMAEGLKPVMPAIREMIRGVAQDVRPMLAAKQQIKFGADLLTFNTAMDAFEQNLDRWSRGEIQPYENPFAPGGKPRLDESGRSPALKAAEQRARHCSSCMY